MTKERANKVYDILVQLGGAAPDMRDSFVYQHNDERAELICDEWRFQGRLGFGGKYRRKQNTVDYYREDETTERKKLAKQINSTLAKET
jgi:hypothetical protein